MPYTFDPDGRQMLVGPGFAPPVDDSLAGAPPTLPIPPEPLTAPSALNAQAPAQVDMPPPQMGGIQPDVAPTPAPQSLPEPPPQTAAPAQVQPDVPVAPPTPQQQRTQAQAAAKQAASDASPAGQQAKADAAYAQSQDEAHRAIDANLDAETQRNDANAAAQKENDDKIKALDAQEQAKRDAYTQTRDQKLAQIDALQKDVDNFKIDPTDGLTSGQHFGMLIAAAVAGLGNAMAGKADAPNPVLQMMKDNVDQNIRLQMDRRQQLKDKVGAAGQSFNRYETISKDDLAQFEIQRGAAYKSLARKMDLIANQTANPLAKANAMKAAADLDAAGAQHLQAGADRAAQHAYQQQQLGVEYARMAQTQKNADRDFAERVREFDQNWAEKEKLAKEANDTKKAAAIAKNRAGAVFDPRTGNPMLNEQGKATMSLADQIEVAARKDPQSALALASRAIQDKGIGDDVKQKLASMKNPTTQDIVNLATGALRDHATTMETANVDPKEREKVQPVVNAAQQLYETTQKMKDFLNGDPSLFDRKEWAKLATQYGESQAELAHLIGAKFSSREADAIDKHLIHGDPDSWMFRAVAKGPAAAQLDEIQRFATSKVDLELKGAGIKDGWQPSVPDKAPTFGGETSQGAAADAEVGSLRRGYDFAVGDNSSKTSNPYAGLLTPEQKQAIAAQRAGVPLSPGQQQLLDRLGGPLPEETTSERQRSAENAGPVTPTGLAPDDTARVAALAKRYDSAPDRDRKLIVSNIVAPILGGDRESLSSGMLSLIKGENPDLYRDVLKQLPPMQRKEIESRDAALAKIQPQLPPLP